MQIAGKNDATPSMSDLLTRVGKQMGHTPTESTTKYYLSSGLDSKLSG